MRHISFFGSGKNSSSHLLIAKLRRSSRKTWKVLAAFVAMTFAFSVLSLPVSATSVSPNACSVSGTIDVVGTAIKYNYGTTPANAINKGCAGVITIPDYVTEIGGSAFGSNSAVTGINFGNSVVTSIGSQAFIVANGLTSVAIPDSVTYVGVGAFEYEANLTTVTVGSGLVEIYPWVFHNDPKLASVTFSNPLTHIQYNAFVGASNVVIHMQDQPGYTFLGWNTSQNGSGTTYAGAALTEALATDGWELYAQWTVAGSSVTYDGNGNTDGSVPTDDSSPYAADSEVTVLANTNNLVKSGSHFTGWNTKADGSGTDYAPTDT